MPKTSTDRHGLVWCRRIMTETELQTNPICGERLPLANRARARDRGRASHDTTVVRWMLACMRTPESCRGVAALHLGGTQSCR